MNKFLKRILTLALLLSMACCSFAFATEADAGTMSLPPFVRDDAKVVAVFAAGQVQQMPASAEEVPADAPGAPAGDPKPLMLDTIWIYYEDNTFVQFAEVRNLQYEPFSAGDYHFNDNGSFFIDPSTENGTIVIERKLKYSKNGPAEYSSSHEYKLGTLGFSQLYGPTDEREVEAIFCKANAFPYTDENGVVIHLDSILLFFTDGSFSVYAIMQNNEAVAAASGTYAFDETGDFAMPPTEKDNGKITLTIADSINEGIIGTSTVYDLGTLGIKPLFQKKH